jgi:hypothetical protein
MEKKDRFVDVDGQNGCYYNTILKTAIGRTCKAPKYFFYPRITEQWKEGNILVVGINHWCPPKTIEDCKYYNECVINCNSSRYNKLCEWNKSDVDREVFDLHYNTFDAFKCYFEDMEGYGCFQEFFLNMTGARDTMETERQKEWWDKNAFYNYIQHYTENSLTRRRRGDVKKEIEKRKKEDFEAFLDVLHDLKPRLVIVWHEEIKNVILEMCPEGELPEGRGELALVDDLGIPSRSMFRFVYSEKGVDDIDMDCYLDSFKEKFRNECSILSSDVEIARAILHLVRWNMFHTEEDFNWLGKLFGANTINEMLEYTDKLTWNEKCLRFLVSEIQAEMGLTTILNEKTLSRKLGNKNSVIYSNVMIKSESMTVKPLTGIHPMDCALYSIRHHEERNLIAMSGLYFDGLRSKFEIDQSFHADAFIVYLAKDYPYGQTFFDRLFDGKYKGEFSLLIIEKDDKVANLYQEILVGKKRLHSIDSCGDYILMQLHNCEHEEKKIEIRQKGKHSTKINADEPFFVEYYSYEEVKDMFEAIIAEKTGVKEKHSLIKHVAAVLKHASEKKLIKVSKGDNKIQRDEKVCTKAGYDLLCRMLKEKLEEIEKPWQKNEFVERLMGHEDVSRIGGIENKKQKIKDKELVRKIENCFVLQKKS